MHDYLYTVFAYTGNWLRNSSSRYITLDATLSGHTCALTSFLYMHVCVFLYKGGLAMGIGAAIVEETLFGGFGGGHHVSP